MFSGQTFDPALDGARLNTQLHKVYDVMRDYQWHTLRELADRVGGSESGVSARLRDLRKQRFGVHVIEGKRIGKSGTWQYRLVL